MSNLKIWLSSPHIGSNELHYVNEAFVTNWIAPLGPHVNAFEQGLQTQTKSSHAAVLSSGTSAIHLALILLEVKAGDTVFCQSITFSASANPIAYQGAIPVFIDSEIDTWNMDPVLLRAALEEAKQNDKLPKAIIPVHLYGMPAKMVEILTIAHEYGVPVIEDAAEALGSSIDNKSCGSVGEFGVLSFNDNKIITTYWCAKETLFKYLGLKGKSLKNDFIVSKFNFSIEEGRISGFIDVNKLKKEITLRYFMKDNFVVVHSV